MFKLENISDGIGFEKYCAELLKENGYQNVARTKSTGDFGVDILAEKEDIKYAFQCKFYHSSVGNSAIQEIVAGRNYYGCDIGVVMTNSVFTSSALRLASSNSIKLWNHDRLIALEKLAQKKISNAKQKLHLPDDTLLQDPIEISDNADSFLIPKKPGRHSPVSEACESFRPIESSLPPPKIYEETSKILHWIHKMFQ